MTDQQREVTDALRVVELRLRSIAEQTEGAVESAVETVRNKITPTLESVGRAIGKSAALAILSAVAETAKMVRVHLEMKGAEGSE